MYAKLNEAIFICYAALGGPEFWNFPFNLCRTQLQILIKNSSCERTKKCHLCGASSRTALGCLSCVDIPCQFIEISNEIYGNTKVSAEMWQAPISLFFGAGFVPFLYFDSWKFIFCSICSICSGLPGASIIFHYAALGGNLSICIIPLFTICVARRRAIDLNEVTTWQQLSESSSCKIRKFIIFNLYALSADPGPGIP